MCAFTAAMSIVSDGTTSTVRHFKSQSPGKTFASPKDSATDPYQSTSVYSGRLRAPPKRLDPCQPTNQLSSADTRPYLIRKPDFYFAVNLNCVCSECAIWCF